MNTYETFSLHGTETLYPGMGLTNGHTSFIDAVHQSGQYYIYQPYDLYSEENHETWARSYRRMQDKWDQYANERYLNGLTALKLPSDRIPQLTSVDEALTRLTGFRTKPVSGYLPAFMFFDCLRRREFPTTITIRNIKDDFSEWPDIFHDVTGHVPMHTDPEFAAALVRFGECAHTAAAMLADVEHSTEITLRLTNIIKALARFFWFTFETGLIRESDGLRVYGSALLSSYSEIEHFRTPMVQKYPIKLEWVINQGFRPNQFQPLLFIVDSFSHLFDLIDELERWMHQGKLDNVAPDEAQVTEEDLESFRQMSTVLAVA